MPLNPEGRRARARLAAHRRWHPGGDLDALTEECHRELELSRIDEGIDDLVARAPKMTSEQAAKIRHLFTYIDPDTHATPPAHDDTAVHLSRAGAERLAGLLSEASTVLTDALTRKLRS